MNNSKKELFKGINEYIIVIFVIGVTALLCRPLSNQQGYHIVSFILLFVVSVMAVFFGIGPILLASSISALAWNFFFIPPHFAFHIEKTEDKLMFGSFFFIALLNGVLTNRIRTQEKLAIEREERTNAIFELTKELSNASGINEILDVAFKDVVRYFGAVSIYFIKEKDQVIEILRRQTEDDDHLKPEKNIAGWVARNLLKAGRFTEFYNDTSLTYYPLTGKRLNPGVLAIQFEKPPEGDKEAFWDGYMAQISNALERELLNELVLKARLLDESDRLYKTLFALISHEFRIPIAAIMGASDTLLMPQTSDPDRSQLLNEIFKASARLNHLVENLLNMSRLESGKISVHLDWCDVNDILNKVSEELTQELEQFSFIGSVPDNMPMVRLDFGLMEQVIYNLMLNACQYSPPGSMIKFTSDYREDSLVIIVEDNGPGFPSSYSEKMFDKFFRINNSKAGGLGLGLSIVKGIVEAHGGTVRAENIKPNGTKFIINIPTDIPDMKIINPEQ